jgi:Fe2+ transport system protein FeoA
MASLDQCTVGQRVIVERIEGGDLVTQRLYEMGILEGAPLELLAFAPLGDPLEIRVRDYRLSLRRSEASRVIVKGADEGVDPVPNPS